MKRANSVSAIDCPVRFLDFLFMDKGICCGDGNY